MFDLTGKRAFVTGSARGIGKTAADALAAAGAKVLYHGATGSELIRAFVLWSSAGREIKDFLIRRRMSEANMYLNGVYSQTPPDHYGYVLYDANGGSVSFRIQGFDAKEGSLKARLKVM